MGEPTKLSNALLACLLGFFLLCLAFGKLAAWNRVACWFVLCFGWFQLTGLALHKLGGWGRTAGVLTKNQEECSFPWGKG